MKLLTDRWLGTQGRGGCNYETRIWDADFYGWICTKCKAYNILRNVKMSLDDPILCPYCGTEDKSDSQDRWPVDEVLDEEVDALTCPRCESKHTYTTLMGPAIWNHAHCMACHAIWHYRTNRQGKREISHSRV